MPQSRTHFHAPVARSWELGAGSSPVDSPQLLAPSSQPRGGFETGSSKTVNGRTGLGYRKNSLHLIYRLIASRRDVRRFLPRLIPDDVLKRLLTAAHHAPSVGFMQPWNFIVIRDPAVKAKIKQVFRAENIKAAQRFRGRRRRLYSRLKLEGIEEAPVNLCVTCDSRRFGPHVLGRNTIRQTDVYSTCCAIQNLWLAARAEGIGVGWVSILRQQPVKRMLGIPPEVHPIAYLCVGYPVEFLDQPELEQVGWAPRLSLERLLFFDAWGRRRPSIAATWPNGR